MCIALLPIASSQTASQVPCPGLLLPSSHHWTILLPAFTLSAFINSNKFPKAGFILTIHFCSPWAQKRTCCMNEDIHEMKNSLISCTMEKSNICDVCKYK